MADGKRCVPESVRKAYLRSMGVTEPNMDYPVRCAYCDAMGVIRIDLRPGQRAGWSQVAGLEWDHILPAELGGDDSLDNLTLACQPCNRSKGHKTLSEWLCAR